MRKALFALMLALASAPAAPQSLTFKQLLDRPGRTALQPDHKIAYGGDTQQYGELWLPAATGPQLRPLVVLIHGGCWLAELPGPELVAFLADELRQRGVAVWSMTYRRIGHDGGGYPGTFQDVSDALALLPALAGKHRLDLDRVVVSGHSAGGHLALWAAGRHRIAAGSALKRDPQVKFKAAVGIAAIPDLAYFARAGAHACGDNTIARLLDTASRSSAGSTGTVDAKAPFRDTSPIEMLPLGVRQILIQGVYDGIVAPANGYRYQSRAKELGEQIELLTLEQAGHFELIAPWTTAGKVVVEKILAALK